MVYYTYLDFMRHMQPCDISRDINFSVFGTFDAFHVEHLSSIESMKKAHETRHGTIPWQSERQPMFLASLNKSNDLFDHQKQEHASWPLLLSVIQVEKQALQGIDFNSLLTEMNRQLTSYLAKEEIGQCYLNLGQADFVIATRTRLLSNATNAIISFWENGIKVGQKIIRILSSSSHCAFAVRNSSELKDDLVAWLKYEGEHNTNLSFEVLYSFSGDSSEITKSGNQFLVLGDSDIQRKPLDARDWESTAEEIYDILTYHSLNNGAKDRYLASVTLPLLEAETFNPLTEGNPSFISQRRQMEKDWEEDNNKLRSAFKDLIDQIPQQLEWDDPEQIKGTIESMSMTIQGLHKYLLRLGTACFENDLESYTERIFHQMIFITNQLTSLIKNGSYRRDSTRHLIREYIDHTARLITELQHLYSVLALSPSTFMETYGSSMRSLNAAATLLSAYQGILIYLNERFPSKWINSSGEMEVSNYAVLMIPYRMTQSSSIILYPSFSPKNRLSLIHIDFTKMFNTKQVLFMLTHEAGHMLGDHNRSERFLPFVRAVLKLYLEQQIFGERFTCPGFTFFKLDGEKNIPHGMSPTKWKKLLKKLIMIYPFF